MYAKTSFMVTQRPALIIHMCNVFVRTSVEGTVLLVHVIYKGCVLILTIYAFVSQHFKLVIGTLICYGKHIAWRVSLLLPHIPLGAFGWLYRANMSLVNEECAM